MDSVNVDLIEKGLSSEQTYNRAFRRQLDTYIARIRPHLKGGKDVKGDLEEVTNKPRTCSCGHVNFDVNIIRHDLTSIGSFHILLPLASIYKYGSTVPKDTGKVE